MNITAMKPATTKQQPPCESQLNSGFSLPQSWQVLRSTLVAKLKKFFQSVRATSRALLASLALLVQEVNSNNRLSTALFFMLAIAPLSGSLYRFFDKSVVVDGWFFVNYFNLLLGLRGNLMAFFTILGIFCLFPARYKASYLISAPLGFIVADAFKKIFATTNDDAHQVYLPKLK